MTTAVEKWAEMKVSGPERSVKNGRSFDMLSTIQIKMNGP